MKVEITDREVFGSIKSEAIHRYLAVNGWDEVRRIDGELIVYEKANLQGKNNLIWMPSNDEFSDYAPMVSRLIKTVSETENKSEIQVIDDLQTVAIGDIIRVRTLNPLDIHDHTILLSDGVNLLNRSRYLALAAASSAVAKRPVHPRKLSNEAYQFVKNLRLGQTERGSFLIRLISPIVDIATGDYLEFIGMDKIPFSRRAVMELVRSLNALKDAAQNNLERGRFLFGSFLDVVSYGVSANLCEALIDPDDKETFSKPVEVSVTWSYAVKSPDHLPTAPIHFEPRLIPYIQQAAREFRVRNPEYLKIMGYVHILERESKSGPGSVRIHSKVDNKYRSIRMNLDIEDYDIAIDAHKKGQVVAVSGSLVVDGSVYRLETPSDFHILGQRDLFEQDDDNIVA